MSFAASLHQRISPFTFIGRLLRLPLRLVPSGLAVPILTGANRGYRWIAGSATAGCWLGIYEEDHQSAMARLVHAGDVAYDIGANVGFYTLLLARLVGSAGRVYAFEPDARNVGLLRRHLQLNGIQNVTIVQAAVSGSSGLVSFGGAKEQGRIVASGGYVVPSLSLDEFISAGHPPPTFAKMDVEGAEGSALAGAAAILARGKTSWMIATHSAELRKQCIAALTAARCTCAAIDVVSDLGDDADFLAIPR